MDLFEPQGAYGRFDPATFGLWINLDYVLEHSDFQGLLPLMLPTFAYDLTAEHRAYIEGKSDAEMLRAANCFTVASHEARHFPDLLASPYGSMLARQFTRAA